VEQRGAYTACQGDSALQVTESGSLHGGSLGAERRHRVRHPAARQVSGRIESALVAVGTAHTRAGAARDDDVRVEGADVLHCQPGPFQWCGQPVRQEHVRGSEQAPEIFSAGVGFDVDGDAAFAPVADLEDEIDVRAGVFLREAADDQRPAGIACLDVFHLDDIGAPVGQRCTGRGHVCPRRQFDDAHTTENSGHNNPFPTASR
jgi:hypothetical protein